MTIANVSKLHLAPGPSNEVNTGMERELSSKLSEVTIGGAGHLTPKDFAWIANLARDDDDDDDVDGNVKQCPIS